MLAEKVRALSLDRLGQQSTRPIAQDFGEVIVDVSWLNQLDNVIFGHGISLLRWRSGGVKHPHDMPPSRFPPSPTFSDSSCRTATTLRYLGSYTRNVREGGRMNSTLFVVAAVSLLVTPGPTNTLLATSGASAGLRRSAHLLVAELGGYLLAIALLRALLGPMIAATPMLGEVLR